jgi:hypothetical protein
VDEALLAELERYQDKLLSFQKLYEDDETIPQDDQDYLESVLNKFPASLWAKEEDDATNSGLEHGTLMAEGRPGGPPSKKKPFKRTPFRQGPAPRKPPTPAPVHKPGTGLADPLPDQAANPPTGVMLWNFEDGKPGLSGQHTRALTSIFLGGRKDLTKIYEVVGFTSGIGLDSVGGSKLAAARARAARDYLISQGWKKTNFARTLGKPAKSALPTDMKGGKPSAEGAARNRRVEIRPTTNFIVLPDEVVDDTDGGANVNPDIKGKDVDVGKQLPDGSSDQTEKNLTIADFSISAVTEALQVIGAGTFGALTTGIINYAQIIDAWEQAQKGANRQGAAYGFKIGADAAVKLISADQEVSDTALWNMVKGKEKTFGNRATPVDWQQVEKAVSEGVWKCAYVIRGMMIDTDRKFKEILDKKLKPKSAGLVFDANKRMIRTRVAEEFAKQIRSKVDTILSSKP